MNGTINSNFIRLIRGISQRVRAYATNMYLTLLDFKAAQELLLIYDNTSRIKKNDIILFCCLRNECRRMPYFFNYYKQLGVGHFILIDNGSNDGIKDLCKNRHDITLYYTEHSFKKARFGMLWINRLLKKYGAGHWCVIVDPDEFLVYPHIKTRNLKALGSFLDEISSPCLHTIMLDKYSDRSLEQTILDSNDDPFEVCQYFDRDGYVQTKGWADSAWIRGGPRMRVYFADAPEKSPALNKIPFIKWKSFYHYRSATHDIYPLNLNHLGYEEKSSAPTGVLFHFKMVANLSEKSKEEMIRAQHYSDSFEYKQYFGAVSSEFYQPGISVCYDGNKQLIDLGLMRYGSWY